MPTTYLGTDEVASWFNVPKATVSQWRRRYSGTDNPCPEPDALIGRTAGWLPERSADWKAWDERRGRDEARPEEERISTTEYKGTDDVGAWFGVPGATVARWRSRYAGTDNPCPEPDALIGRVAGWLPQREADWRAWDKRRAGQGAGGGRKKSPEGATSGTVAPTSRSGSRTRD